MKNKRTISTVALALAASVFLCCSNTFFAILPKNVQIGGVAVGRLTFQQAKEKVRSFTAAQIPPLTVTAPSGVTVFSYPEIDFTDNLDELLPKVKRNQSYPLAVTYYLKAESLLLKRLAEENDVAPQDASLTFDGSFRYTRERAGRACDIAALRRDIDASLCGSFAPVVLPWREIAPAKGIDRLYEETRLLSSFTTCFDPANAPRCHNIALAAASVNGTVLPAGELFSFNRAVGARTEERGYQKAKIISGGKFVPGTGGGVCQVSTTLYNAALLCGMRIQSVRAHSLPVSYVEPSFDAMVSSSSDLTFCNPFSTPVYIACSADRDSVTVKIYGKESGYRYERVSEVISYIEPGESEIEEGDEDAVKRKPVRGVKSTGTLVVYKGDRKVCEKKIRSDEYACARGVIVKKRAEEKTDKEAE